MALFRLGYVLKNDLIFFRAKYEQFKNKENSDFKAKVSQSIFNRTKSLERKSNLFFLLVGPGEKYRNRRQTSELHDVLYGIKRNFVFRIFINFYRPKNAINRVI